MKEGDSERDLVVIVFVDTVSVKEGDSERDFDVIADVVSVKAVDSENVWSLVLVAVT